MNKDFRNITDTQYSKEAGISLVEAVCAIAVLTIGLIGTAAAITSAMKLGQISSNATEAKNIVLSQIEEIHSLRDSRRLRFRQIDNNPLPAGANTGASVSFDGFINGFQPVSTEPGDDGVFGTMDDLAGAPPVREGFMKQIQIIEPSGTTDLKRIVVTVQYPGGDGQTYTIASTSYLNNDYRQ